MGRHVSVLRHKSARKLLPVLLLALFGGLVLNMGLVHTWLGALNRSFITVNKVKRAYELVLPTQQRDGPFPLIVFLQDPSETMKAMRLQFGFDALAPRKKFAVVYPQTEGAGWTFAPDALPDHADAKKTQDDMEFIEELVKDLVTRNIADPARIYLVGETGGGRFALLEACEHPDRFAAVAAIMTTMPKIVAKHCTPKHAMPVLMMNGTNDLQVSWQGMSNPDPSLAFLSVSDSAAFWKKADACDNAPDKKTFPHLNPDDTTAARLELYPRCALGSQVAVYVIDSGGHQLPSVTGDNLWNDILGPRNHDIDANEEIWGFFEKFRR